jgi:sarcosine oxidase subunit gamma
MSDATRRESPLVAHLTAGMPVRLSVQGLALQERAFLGHVNLRCDPDDATTAARLEAELGCALPRTPNTFTVAADGGKVLWLGPDEFLAVTPDGREAGLADALRRAAGTALVAVNELGPGQTVIELSGPRAREVLAKGCPLDLHPRVFGPGRCAQSRLARALVTIAQVEHAGDGPLFDVIVRRSFADYLWRWLADASEFAVLPRYV